MKDESFENITFNLFDALTALDHKDYDYYDNLTDEQQKSFVPYLLLQWMSTINSKNEISDYYLCSTNYHANKHLVNESIQNHPKLQWLMLCASSPGINKQFHTWVSQLNTKVCKLKEKATAKNVKDFFTKSFPHLTKEELSDVVNKYVSDQNKKMFFAEEYPSMKFEDIDVLNKVITDEEIKKYREESGY